MFLISKKNYNMKTTIIEHPSDLNYLTAFGFLKRRGLGKIQLSSETFEHSQKEEFEENINKNYYACGCDTGAKGLILTLIGGILYSVWTYKYSDTTTTILVLNILGAAVTGAVLGKLYGKFQANLRLKETIKIIQQHWKIGDNPTPARNHFNCG
jgi:hypothetical protein